MPVHTLTFSRLTGALGAQVDGVDLREPLDDDTFAAIHDALVEHQVIFFRNQHLNDNQQLDFGRRFGELSVYPTSVAVGDNAHLGTLHDDAERRPRADGWHTDLTWTATPPRIALLSARTIPGYGGDTLWASLHSLYNALSPRMQAICDALWVRHVPSEGIWAAAESMLTPDELARMRSEYTPAEHPLVSVHPVSGRKALFVSHAFMEGVVGMHPAESSALLDHFRGLLDNPNHYVRWRWQVGDLAIWDERSTNHRALADHYPQERVMRRCTVEGEPPQPVAAAAA